MNCRILHLLLTGFMLAIVKCAAQSPAELDYDVVRKRSGSITWQALTRGFNKSEPIINLSSLKGMSNLMSYDAKMGSTLSGGPLRFDYGAPNLGVKATKIDDRPWRLGIEQAERINLMQMNEYRQRATLENASVPTLTVPAGGEMIFNAK
jgi:hypothetical protein